MFAMQFLMQCSTADVNTRSKSVEAMGTLGCGTLDEKTKLLTDPEPIVRASAIQLVKKEEKDGLLPLFQHALAD